MSQVCDKTIEHWLRNVLSHMKTLNPLEFCTQKHTFAEITHLSSLIGKLLSVRVSIVSSKNNFFVFKFLRVETSPTANIKNFFAFLLFIECNKLIPKLFLILGIVHGNTLWVIPGPSPSDKIFHFLIKFDSEVHFRRHFNFQCAYF